MVVFLAAFIGGGIGSLVALMIRRHPRPVLTGALVVPALATVTIATLRLFGDQDSAVVLVVLVIAFAATLLLVRLVAMLGYDVKGGSG